MDDKKRYLSQSGYNLHGSTYSINLPTGGVTGSGYRGSNEFIRKFIHFRLKENYDRFFISLQLVADDTPKSTTEQLKEIPAFFRRKAKNMCRKKILYKRIPILNWLPKYNTSDAVGDLVAGFTVGKFFFVYFYLSTFFK